MNDFEIAKQHWTPETDAELDALRIEFSNTTEPARREELERIMDERNREAHGVKTRLEVGL